MTVTWDADVVWDVSATGAALKIDLDIGGVAQRMSMPATGTSGTARALVFRYTVQSTDTDTDGIFPKPGGGGTDLVLLTRGATLTSAAGSRNARRMHAALAPDPAHQVNGRRLPSGAPNPQAPAPAITAVALTSTPSIDADGDGTPETYGAGETIEVTVTWDADVVWDVSATDAALKIDLDIGGVAQRMSMPATGTSGTARALVFHYVVQSTDTDTDGIFPKPGGGGYRPGVADTRGHPHECRREPECAADARSPGPGSGPSGGRRNPRVYPAEPAARPRHRPRTPRTRWMACGRRPYPGVPGGGR